MDDGGGPGDRVRNGRRVGQGRLDELVRDAGEVRSVTDGQIVEDPDPVAALGEQPADRRPDEAGSADDEDGPVQRREASADVPAPAVGSGTQRTF